MSFMKQSLSVTILLLTVSTALFGIQGVRYSVLEGDQSQLFEKVIHEKLWSIDFVLSDPLTRVNDVYKDDYGSTDLDNLAFSPISNDQVMLPLLLKAPELGAFTPFNLHLFKRMSENKTYVGHLMPATMLDIAGVDSQEIRLEFIRQFNVLDTLIEKELGGNVEYIEYAKLPASPLLQFSFPILPEVSLESRLDIFQEKFEMLLEKRGYIITGYRDIKAIADERGISFSKYGAYRVYSFCHIAFSEALFNHGRPDAGVFAPCSLYIYNVEGSDTVVIGVAAIENWMAVMGINDKDILDMARHHDDEIVEIMKKLGGSVL